MESIICKNCNGNQFDISGGRYVCKFCGTVFIDKEKSKTERLYLLARRAKDENNAENAVKYYEMILPDDPLNWEPAFYSAYFKARDTTIKDIGSSAYTMSKSLDSIMMIVSTDNITDQEKESIVIEVADKIMDLGEMMFSAALDFYRDLDIYSKSSRRSDHIDRLSGVKTMLYQLGDSIEEWFGDNPLLIAKARTSWQMGVIVHKKFAFMTTDPTTAQRIIDMYDEKSKA